MDYSSSLSSKSPFQGEKRRERATVLVEGPVKSKSEKHARSVFFTCYVCRLTWTCKKILYLIKNFNSADAVQTISSSNSSSPTVSFDMSALIQIQAIKLRPISDIYPLHVQAQLHIWSAEREKVCVCVTKDNERNPQSVCVCDDVCFISCSSHVQDMCVLQLNISSLNHIRLVSISPQFTFSFFPLCSSSRIQYGVSHPTEGRQYSLHSQQACGSTWSEYERE